MNSGNDEPDDASRKVLKTFDSRPKSPGPLSRKHAKTLQRCRPGRSQLGLPPLSECQVAVGAPNTGTLIFEQGLGSCQSIVKFGLCKGVLLPVMQPP